MFVKKMPACLLQPFGVCVTLQSGYYWLKVNWLHKSECGDFLKLLVNEACVYSGRTGNMYTFSI